MKRRNGFVSNSSSSSFTVEVRNDTDKSIPWDEFIELYKMELAIQKLGYGREAEEYKECAKELSHYYTGFFVHGIEAGKRYIMFYVDGDRGEEVREKGVFDVDRPQCDHVVIIGNDPEQLTKETSEE